MRCRKRTEFVTRLSPETAVAAYKMLLEENSELCLGDAFDLMQEWVREAADSG